MKRYIRAMAFDKQTIVLRLTNHLEQLTDHLIKLYLFPNTEYVNHWRKEVWNLLNRVPKMSSNNKLPSYDLIYSAISGYLDQTDSMMYLVLDEYAEHTPQRADAEELEIILSNYFQWIAHILSDKGAVRSSEVYAKLEELGL